MAAMLEWPEELIPSEMTVNYRSNTAVFQSPFNKASQTVSYPGSRFAFTLTFNNMTQEEIDLLNVVIVSLNGPAGKIKLRDFSKGFPSNVGTITAEQYRDAKTVDVKGFIPRSQKVLNAGAYVTINDQLLLLSKAVTTDADGKARLEFANVLRNKTVPAGKPVYVSPPYGIFKLTEDENGGSRSPGMTGTMSLTFEEDIYVI